MKRLLALFFAGILAFSFSSCGNGDPIVPEAQGGIHTDGGDVYPEDFLKFDGEEISFAEFRYYYLNYRNEYLKEADDYFQKEGTQEALKKEVLQCLLDSWAVRFLAKEHKISLTRDERKAVEGDVESTAELYGGQDAFLAMLDESYMSPSLYHYMMEYSALYLKVFNTLFDEEDGKMTWSDETFYNYYRNTYLAVQQIYLPYAEGETAENCPTTKSEAETILQKIREGADFWKMIETHGKDDNMLDYPDGYYFKEGEAEDVLYQASRELKIGQISEPVAAASGVYLIRRMELQTRRMDENRQTALYGYYDTFDEWHAGAYDTVFRELYEERGRAISIEYSDYWNMISTETVF